MRHLFISHTRSSARWRTKRKKVRKKIPRGCKIRVSLMKLLMSQWEFYLIRREISFSEMHKCKLMGIYVALLAGLLCATGTADGRFEFDKLSHINFYFASACNFMPTRPEVFKKGLICSVCSAAGDEGTWWRYWRLFHSAKMILGIYDCRKDKKK